MKITNLHHTLLTVCAVAAFAANNAFADKHKADNTTSLNDPASWSENATPDDTEFGLWDSTVTSANTVSLGADLIWGGIKIINPGGPVGLTSGNSLTLDAPSGIGIDMSTALQNLELDCDVLLATNQTWTVASPQTLTVGGNVSGTNALIINGGGTLILSNKTYSGGTTISNGLVMAWNDNGNYTISGGSLLLEYGSFWSGPTVSFTTDAQAGTDNGRLDFAGVMGAPGFQWTKIGSGGFNTTYWQTNLHVVQASSILVAEGTLGALPNSQSFDTNDIAQWGGSTVTITVSNANNASLAKYDTGVVPNPIILQGDSGNPNGVLQTGHINGNNANAVITFQNTITLNGSSTVNAGYGVMVLAGNISGPGGLTKNGNYPLVLGGTNTYGGDTTINASTVQLASSAALPGGATNGNVTLYGTSKLDLNGFNATLNRLADDGGGAVIVDNSSSSPATLTFGGNNQDVPLTGPVKNTGGGPLSIVKIGSGNASLLGANTYSGSNVVSGGKLDMNIPTGTTTANGPVVVADGAELSLHYRLAGSSIKATGAILGTSGTTTLDFDLAAYGNPSSPIINATNGTGVLSANGTINVNFAGDSSVMSKGQFPIIKYTTRTGNGVFVLGSLPANVGAQIVTNASGKSIDLNITNAPVTTWVGNVNNLWDTTTANWSVLGVGGKKYTDGVGVLFGDTALTNNVDLTTTLYPSATLVNSTNNYTFYSSGASGLLNNGDLTKNGSGKLTLLTANSYNNTTVAGGTLQVDTNGTTATLGYGNVDVEGTLIFDRADNISIGNAISGAGTVVQQSAATLTLSGANTYSGGTTISQGVVKAGNASALGAPASGVAMATVASGATLDLGGQSIAITNVTFIGGSGYAVMNSGGGTCIGCGNVGLNNVNLTADATLSGNNDWTIGNSGLGLSGNNHSLTKLGGGWLYLHSAALTPFNQFVIGGGGVIIESANPFGTGSTLVLSNNAATDSWGNNSGGPVSYTIANNIIITNGGGRITTTRGHWWSTPDYDTYSGSITLYDNLTVQNSSANGSLLGKLTISGPISGSGPVVKLGANQVTFSGANSYTGPTTVSNGVLAVSATTSGGGGYTLNDGATLDVPAQTSASTLSMSNLTLGASTGCALSFTRVLSLSTNPVITATNLTLNGSTIVTVSPGAFAVAGQFPLIKFSGAIAGSGTIGLGTSVRGLPGTIVTNVGNSSIDLLVPAGNPVFWTGSANNVWDIAGTSNFKYLGSATTYQQPTAPGDAVTFDDTGANTTINISASVSPTMIVVSNASKTYVLTNNVIAGTGGLLKQGTGMLVLSNGANTFTGSATVSGGTVQLGNDGSLNNSSGTVTVSGNGAVDFNNYNPTALACTISGAGFGGKGTLVANYTNAAATKGPKTITMAGDATIGGSNRWDLRASGAALITPTNAYTLSKVGANQISIVGAAISPNLGDIKCLGGILSFETTSTLGDNTKTIYIGNGGGLGLYQNSVPVTKSIICSNGGSIYALGGNVLSQNMIAAPIWATDGRITINANYNNTISISNVISGDGGVYVQWNSDAYLSATNTFKGDFETQGRTRLVGNASINSTNNLTINNGGSGVLTIQDNAAVGGQHLRIWSGPATGALIVKNNGTINTKSIEVGTAFADWSGRSDGTLTLQSGQTLRIDSGGRVKGNVVAPTGSIFSPGGGNYIQNGGIMTNNLTLQVGSTTFMDISVDGGATNNDAVTVLGTLTYGGTLQINRMGTNALAAGNTFKLFTFSTTPVGGFATVTANTPGQFVTWDTSQLSVNGTLRVASVTSSTSPTLAGSFSSGNLNLSWPAANLGWRLLLQTNNLASGISTNHLDWGTVPGSTNVTSVSIPISTSTPCEFYRLTYP